MPIGNLTSQFFANVYLNELDQFVKHVLKVKYYLRYVDDLIILHSSKKQLKDHKLQINLFLKEKLKLDLHPDKSKIISLSRGVDFLGFRSFWQHALLRKRNIQTMRKKVSAYKAGEICFGELFDSFKGWQAYACWANTYNIQNNFKRQIIDALWEKI